MELKAGIYKSTKGNQLVICEDGRPMYSLWDGEVFGKREKFTPKYKTYSEFVQGQKLVRTGNFEGTFF